MKAKELREKKDQELISLIEEQKERLGQLKFDLAFKKLKDVNELKKIRKNIAQALTILKERRQNETK